jgi:hypothetical protein
MQSHLQLRGLGGRIRDQNRAGTNQRQQPLQSHVQSAEEDESSVILLDRLVGSAPGTKFKVHASFQPADGGTCCPQGMIPSRYLMEPMLTRDQSHK